MITNMYQVVVLEESETLPAKFEISTVRLFVLVLFLFFVVVLLLLLLFWGVEGVVCLFVCLFSLVISNCSCPSETAPHWRIELLSPPRSASGVT